MDSLPELPLSRLTLRACGIVGEWVTLGVIDASIRKVCGG